MGSFGCGSAEEGFEGVLDVRLDGMRVTRRSSWRCQVCVHHFEFATQMNGPGRSTAVKRRLCGLHPLGAPARVSFPKPHYATSNLCLPLYVLRLYIQMRYEWDEKKNRLNQKKHRISFEMAALAFEDECCLVRPDRVDETGEQRWQAIGAARLSPDASVVLFVVHVYREEIDGEEITRIISARRANKDDFRRYQEQEMD